MVRFMAAGVVVTAVMGGVSGCAGPGRAPSRKVAQLRERVNLSYPNPPRLVMAFYYVWYATEQFSGSNQHWGWVDTDNKWIEQSLHYPQGGPYDSTDPQLVRRHLAMFRRAGIDVPIVSWWGPGHHSDKAMPVLLDHAGEFGRQVTVYFETVRDPISARSAADDLVYLARQYANHPAFLKIDGRPVIFIYGRILQQLPEPEIVEALEIARRESGVDWVAICDLPDRMRALLFDGLHTYAPMASYFRRPQSDWEKIATRDYGRIVHLARQRQRIAALTVFPGYDDRKIRKPGAFAERADGKLYDLVWQKAIEAGPDWILITSFNELHEGSEIEPTAELGDSYIEGTARWSKKFRESARVKPPVVAEARAKVGRKDLQRVLRRLGRGRIGVFGGVNMQVMRLLALTDRVELLTAEELVAPEVKARAYPLLIYAGGEMFPSSVRADNDVPNKLAEYLSGGGRLLVMPSGPLPFFYDRPGHVAQAGERFGLYVKGLRPTSGVAEELWGFEQPPGVAKLSFHADPALPNLPRHWAFPSAGDLRWRPVVPPPDLSDRNRYVSLVRLLDEEGAHYGDAVGLYEYHEGPLAGGRILYVWFRLADEVPTDDLLHDVLAVLGRRK